MKKEKILIKSGLNKKGQQKFSTVDVYTNIPKGWKEISGVSTAPQGYKWIYNGESLFSKGANGNYEKNIKRKTALLKK